MPSVSRNVAVNTVGKIVPPLLALATQPLLALGLGVDGRGELAAAVAPLMLVSVILTLGVPDAFTYYIARRTAGLPRLLTVGFVVLGLAGILGSGIVAAAAPLLTRADTALALLITVAGLGIVPSLLVSGLRGIAAGRHAWSRVALERILGAALRLGLVLALFVSDTLTPLTATVVFALTNFISGVVFLWPHRTPLSPRVPGATTGPDAVAGATADAATPGGAPTNANEEPLPEEGRVSVLGYGFRVWLGTAVGALMARLDQVLMTPIATVEQLGLYAVAYSVSEVALMFNTAIREVMFSVEAEKPSEERVALASRLSTLVTVALSVVIAAFAPWVFPWLFGEGFAAAVPVLWILLLGVIVGNPGSMAGIALSARGRPELRSAAIGIAVVINIVLVLVLTPPFGAIGAAAATLVGNFFSGNLCILFLRRRFGVPMHLFYAFRVDDLRELRTMVRQLLERRRARA